MLTAILKFVVKENIKLADFHFDLSGHHSPVYMATSEQFLGNFLFLMYFLRRIRI
jgi:hypothetical protein